MIEGRRELGAGGRRGVLLGEGELDGVGTPFPGRPGLTRDATLPLQVIGGSAAVARWLGGEPVGVVLTLALALLAEAGKEGVFEVPRMTSMRALCVFSKAAWSMVWCAVTERAVFLIAWSICVYPGVVARSVSRQWLKSILVVLRTCSWETDHVVSGGGGRVHRRDPGEN